MRSACSESKAPDPTLLQTRPLVVAVSARMRASVALAERVARHDTTVLIHGETGTGKELLARLIHAASPRAGRPLVPLNCAAIPEHLLESELFGYRKGAFTGAATDKPGLLAAAAGGTLFLDEVGDLPLTLQVKLLRVLQERSYFPVGAVHAERADVRVIAATNVPLREGIAGGRFRSDLYHRLSAFPIEIPPLRDRPADVDALARHFLRELATCLERSADLSPAARDFLGAQPWPGNARELRNAIERALILTSTQVLDVADFSFLAETAARVEEPHRWNLPASGIDLPSLNDSLVYAAFERADGNVTRAARLLGLSRPAMRYRLKKAGLGS